MLKTYYANMKQPENLQNLNRIRYVTNRILLWTFSAMTSKNQNDAAIVWGLGMEVLWRGWHFAMIGMKKLQDTTVMHVFAYL